MRSDIEAAERGDRAAARHLMQVAADSLSRGVPLDDDLAQWLSKCLLSIAEGVRPDRAFGVSDPIGGRPPADDEKLMTRWQCFAQVEHLKATGKAKTITEAAAILSERNGLEIGTIETYRKQVIKEMKAAGDIEKVRDFLTDPDSIINGIFESLNQMTEEERVKIAQAARNIESQKEEGN